ncbi:TPA: hypothetical protein DCZ39_01100 [Patescibacteria group bacterium]|nr:hypothetical protein [Candidatus Gracilibacteria bacterium]
MNITLPGQTSPYFFSILMSIMLVVCVGFLLFFRRKKWI